MAFCTKCGHSNQETVKFCKQCGQPLGRRQTSADATNNDVTLQTSKESSIKSDIQPAPEILGNKATLPPEDSQIANHAHIQQDISKGQASNNLAGVDEKSADSTASDIKQAQKSETGRPKPNSVTSRKTIALIASGILIVAIIGAGMAWHLLSKPWHARPLKSFAGDKSDPDVLKELDIVCSDGTRFGELTTTNAVLRRSIAIRIPQQTITDPCGNKNRALLNRAMFTGMGIPPEATPKKIVPLDSGAFFHAFTFGSFSDNDWKIIVTHARTPISGACLNGKSPKEFTPEQALYGLTYIGRMLTSRSATQEELSPCLQGLGKILENKLQGQKEAFVIAIDEADKGMHRPTVDWQGIMTRGAAIKAAREQAAARAEYERKVAAEAAARAERERAIRNSKKPQKKFLGIF